MAVLSVGLSPIVAKRRLHVLAGDAWVGVKLMGVAPRIFFLPRF